MAIVIWFTGLSGSGKSTIAEALKTELESRGNTVEILDGDVVREKYPVKLGFSREDVKENNRRIAEMAKNSDAEIILIPVISPYREDRAMAREIVTRGENKFYELFLNCSLQKCAERDVKGLYQKAKQGEIDNLVGFSTSNPYEAPLQPDIELLTEQESKEQSVQKIILFLNSV